MVGLPSTTSSLEKLQQTVQVRDRSPAQAPRKSARLSVIAERSLSIAESPSPKKPSPLVAALRQSMLDAQRAPITISTSPASSVVQPSTMLPTHPPRKATTSPAKAKATSLAKGTKKVSSASAATRNVAIDKSVKVNSDAKKHAISKSKGTSIGKGHAGSSKVEEAPIPSGFRLSSTGHLIPVVVSTRFSFDADAAFASASTALTKRQRAVLTAKQEKADQQKATTSQTKAKAEYKANAVPDWILKRKEQLKEEEERRLALEMKWVQEKELGSKRKACVEKKNAVNPPPRGAKAVAKVKLSSRPFVSSTEVRLTERAEWEKKRQANENAIEAARSKAREERERIEEEEIKELRRRAVPKANPVPEWLSGGTVTRQSLHGKAA